MPTDNHVGGAPSKFRKEFCQMLVSHMSEGLSFNAFAKIAQVDQDTLYEWVKVHPEFSEAKKRAFEENRFFWEKTGLDGMHQRPDKPALNPTIYIFNMKNRFPKEWRDRQEIDAKVESKTEHTASPELAALKELFIKVLSDK